ncbi:ranBP-type and C3HC4-type zinc finger-containing protein 1-like isoform X2 [Mya arenaria]|uniref:ranBP-type and C3HC4-type zinc finger-containing protein 1-like isoform X2 n=1 Tax=Mya arenaria TaxID=6604 RepID=UPI0022DEE297|nr:ranBP-type and C3HC4-type zinc finger-containing protein 1-like isoform X2 [Mya arenaria]
MPFFGKGKNKNRRRCFYTDQLVKDYSVGRSLCELYFPSPSLDLDEFGAIKEVCISGDLEMISTKDCTIHLCEIPNFPANCPFHLDDTGQTSEVCLSIDLRTRKTGDLSYTVRDKYWHEIRKKVGKWQRFLIHFDDADNNFVELEQKLENTLALVNEAKPCSLFLLVAVQSPAEKRKSQLNNRHSRISLADLQIVTGQDRSSPQVLDDSDSDNDDAFGTDNGVPLNHTDGDTLGIEADLIPPPFDDIAPYDPDGILQTLARYPTIFESVDNSSVLTNISNLCDSLHIHPNELPQTLESILKSAAEITLSGNICDINEDKSAPEKDNCTDGGKESNFPTYFSLGQFKSDIEDHDKHGPSPIKPKLNSTYFPMGVVKRSSPEIRERKMSDSSKPSLKLKKCQETAKLLQTAINSSDVQHAQEYAKQLAVEKVEVDIDVKLKENKEEENQFDLKVSIEDKEASGVCITLKVRATDTLRDLKNKMLLKHSFPVEVQRWIIGQRIPMDNETLAQCRVKNHGYTCFLYLMSAKSVGLSREEFRKKQEMLLNPNAALGAMGPAGPCVDVTPGRGPRSPAPSPSPLVQEVHVHVEQDAKLKASVDNFNIKEEKKTPEKMKEKFQQRQAANPQTRYRGHVEVPIHGAVGQTGADIRDVLNTIAPKLAAMNIGARQPVEDEEPQQGWHCEACTYINLPTRPGCEVCSSARPLDYMMPPDYMITDEEKKRLELEELIEKQTREAQMEERNQNFQQLQAADTDNVISNMHEFTCPICFEDIPRGDGVVLRECLHSFCKDCLRDAVKYNEEPVLKCPFQDENYTCNGVLQDREVKGLVNAELYGKYLARSLSTAESQANNSFHCKTMDCPGWCIYEDLVNFFVCQVCGIENCLTCKAIHTGMNCKQYQDDLNARSTNDKAASQTKIMIKKMLDDGEAMNCPQCKVIVMKKEGCDWIMCSICKTEICWVTKQARWGPMGNGDISGGCKCRVNGVMCHPNCNNCH